MLRNARLSQDGLLGRHIVRDSYGLAKPSSPSRPVSVVSGHGQIPSFSTRRFEHSSCFCSYVRVSTAKRNMSCIFVSGHTSQRKDSQLSSQSLSGMEADSQQKKSEFFFYSWFAIFFLMKTWLEWYRQNDNNCSAKARPTVYIISLLAIQTFASQNT